jgi:hypothetical protein
LNSKKKSKRLPVFALISKLAFFRFIWFLSYAFIGTLNPAFVSPIHAEIPKRRNEEGFSSRLLFFWEHSRRQ